MHSMYDSLAWRPSLEHPDEPGSDLELHPLRLSDLSLFVE